MRVLVLGCGPAGLIAAHAAVRLGSDIVILSKARKSRMHGAQYLHSHIPGTPDSRFEVDYRMEGTADGYRDKVYGPGSTVGVSPDLLMGRSPAWDIRATYDALWDLYGGTVEGWEASPEGLIAIQRALKPDLTISTIPAKLLCHGHHTFASATVWSTDWADGLPADNVVLCSGREEDDWYRKSRIQGWENTEFSQPDPHRGHQWEVVKPLWNDCDCFENVLRLGRYGNWTKGILSDSAYDDTQKAIMR